MITKEVNNYYTPLGFDEINGMRWEEKWKYTEKVYCDIINALDPARVDYVRPINHIFKIFSHDASISQINHHINHYVLDNDTTKLDLLIQEYKRLCKL